MDGAECVDPSLPPPEKEISYDPRAEASFVRSGWPWVLPGASGVGLDESGACEPVLCPTLSLRFLDSNPRAV